MYAKRTDGGRDPVLTNYESREVDIPEEYLTTDPPDAEPITFSQIEFENTELPQYKGAQAFVLDHVLSPSECAKLIELAESSVLDKDRGEGGTAWNPAMVNVGGGFEALVPDYRNSDRIIWDTQVIADRLWARIARVPGIHESKLGSFHNGDLLGTRLKESKGKRTRWDFERANKRLRFLKYGPGQFFSPHCDGSYAELAEDSRSVLRTHFTLHLYLNDSRQEVGGTAELVGGATSFLSSDEKRRIDIDPKAGRVLIFQHMRLYHSGDNVKEGIKYTVRTDLLYRMHEEKIEPADGKVEESAST